MSENNIVRLEPDVNEYLAEAAFLLGRSKTNLVNIIIRQIKINLPKQQIIEIDVEPQLTKRDDAL